MQHKQNLLQRVHLMSSTNSKSQRQCAQVHSVQFFCILFISAFSVEIRPRAFKVLTEKWPGEMLDSEANVTLSKEEVWVNGKIRSGGGADASILTNQLKIFQNRAKINSVKIKGRYGANRRVVVVFVNFAVVAVVAIVVTILIRRICCNPRAAHRNSLYWESGRERQVMVALLPPSALSSTSEWALRSSRALRLAMLLLLLLLLLSASSSKSKWASHLFQTLRLTMGLGGWVIIE